MGPFKTPLSGRCQFMDGFRNSIVWTIPNGSLPNWLSTHFQLIDKSPKPIVRTIPISRQSDSNVQTIPIMDNTRNYLFRQFHLIRSPKLIVRTIPINILWHNFSGQFKLFESTTVRHQLVTQFESIDSLWNQMSQQIQLIVSKTSSLVDCNY